MISQTLRAQLEASVRSARAQDEAKADMERARIAFGVGAYKTAYQYLQYAMGHLDTLIALNTQPEERES